VTNLIMFSCPKIKSQWLYTLYYVCSQQLYIGNFDVHNMHDDSPLIAVILFT